jgi:hypothetical protein
VHLPTVSAQTRGSALPALISQSSLPSRTNAACERPASGRRALPPGRALACPSHRTDRSARPCPHLIARQTVWSLPVPARYKPPNVDMILASRRAAATRQLRAPGRTV